MARDYNMHSVIMPMCLFTLLLSMCTVRLSLLTLLMILVTLSATLMTLIMITAPMFNIVVTLRMIRAVTDLRVMMIQESGDTARRPVGNTAHA